MQSNIRVWTYLDMLSVSVKEPQKEAAEQKKAKIEEFIEINKLRGFKIDWIKDRRDGAESVQQPCQTACLSRPLLPPSVISTDSGVKGCLQTCCSSIRFIRSRRVAWSLRLTSIPARPSRCWTSGSTSATASAGA